MNARHASLSLLVAVVLLSCCAQALPQLEFTIDVTASFNPNAPASCEYCDSKDSMDYREGARTQCTYPIGDNIPSDDCQMRWGSVNLAQNPTPLCFNASGAGFRGLRGITLTSNPTDDTPTKIGEFTHYNNVIQGGTTTPYKLRLTMNVTSPQLTQPFLISYPLGFFETTNTDSMSDCDPSFQYHDKTCDDRFTFNTDIGLQASFVFENVRYTLEIAGFSQGDSLQPVRYFSTREQNASRADVYARLITVCDSTVCGPNEQFFKENCTCGCLLDGDLCQATLGPNWTLDESACGCVCGLNATTANCTAGEVWNADSCSCGCNLTDAYCSTINPTFEVIGEAEECLCGCPRDSALYCARTKGQFYAPAGNSCVCECAVTDDKCREAFGEGYTVDVEANNCGCIIPGGGGLSDGDIAGIVIGSVVGGSLLAGLFIAAGALLIYLIRAGKIAGIYGYKLEPALLDGVNESPLYNSPWSNNSPLNS